MTDADPMSTEAGPRRRVPGNRWDLLVPEHGATWTPRRTVSVCIPARDPGDELERLLRVLSAQTYPHHLIEVIVADDTSEQPITIAPGTTPFDVRVVRQDADGFAAGRARHLAAGAATGEVLVFFDADMVPSRHVLDVYLRWFERDAAVVPFGFTEFVEWPGHDIEAVVEAVRSDDYERLDGTAEVDSQNWRERTFAATDDLRSGADDIFRTLVGATLAVSSEQYEECGGFRDLGVRGVEDIEFGYRLQNNGALLIPERAARHWHPGGRTMSGARVAEIRRQREPFTSALLPVGRFRPEHFVGPSPVEIVPKLLVHVAGDGDAGAVDPVIEQIEASGGVDVAARVGTMDTEFSSAFAQATVAQGVVWRDGAPQAIVDELQWRDVGTLLVVSQPGALIAEVITTRAIRSVRRLDVEGRRDIRRLFGVAIVDADRVRLETDDVDGRPAGSATEAVAVLGARVTRLARRIGGALSRAWSARRPTRPDTRAASRQPR